MTSSSRKMVATGVIFPSGVASDKGGLTRVDLPPWCDRGSFPDMAKRVEGKAAIVVGGGQTPGQTIGNGRATAIVLAREGAKVIVADRSLKAAQETGDLNREEGGPARAFS